MRFARFQSELSATLKCSAAGYGRMRYETRQSKFLGWGIYAEIDALTSVKFAAFQSGNQIVKMPRYLNSRFKSWDEIATKVSCFNAS